MFTATGAFADSKALRNCKAFADTTRELLPITADKATTVIGVDCVERNEKTTFIYTVELEFSPEVLSELGLTGLSHSELIRRFDFSQVNPSLLNSWCTDTRQLFDLFDVSYQYYMTDGTYVGEQYIANDDCSS